jgi:hypothetical protein
MAIINPADQNNYQQLLQQLLGLLLNQAYPAGQGVAAKDAIIDVAGDVHDILTTLNQGALDSATPQYAALKTDVAAVNTNLNNVKVQISNWIQGVGIAAQVVSVIGQVAIAAARIGLL